MHGCHPLCLSAVHLSGIKQGPKQVLQGTSLSRSSALNGRRRGCCCCPQPASCASLLCKAIHLSSVCSSLRPLLLLLHLLLASLLNVLTPRPHPGPLPGAFVGPAGLWPLLPLLLTSLLT